MTNAMSSLDMNAVLNRLLILHHRSLPVYVSQATPWVASEWEPAWEAVQSIASDHRATADRFTSLILAEGETPVFGEFPIRYTALNDLALDYLVGLIIEYQRQLIQRITECSELLRLSPTVQAIALESLGEAKAHLLTLEEKAA